jgi:hypothetical protein
MKSILIYFYTILMLFCHVFTSVGQSFSSLQNHCHEELLLFYFSFLNINIRGIFCFYSWGESANLRNREIRNRKKRGLSVYITRLTEHQMFPTRGYMLILDDSHSKQQLFPGGYETIFLCSGARV